MDGWMGFNTIPFTVAMWVSRLFKFRRGHTIVRNGRRYGQSHFFSWTPQYKIVHKNSPPALHSGDRRGELTECESSVPSRYLSVQSIASPLQAHCQSTVTFGLLWV